MTSKARYSEVKSFVKGQKKEEEPCPPGSFFSLDPTQTRCSNTILLHLPKIVVACNASRDLNLKSTQSYPKLSRIKSEK